MSRVVIDADGHVAEPLDLFEKYGDVPLHGRMPRVVKDDLGYDRWVIEGKLYPIPEGREIGPKLRYGVFRKGMLDASERLKDMDTEAIQIAVIFPSVALRFGWGIENPELAVVASRAYNNFLLEYCSAAPQRLKGVAALPLQDPSGAAEELRRCVGKGMVAGFVPPHLRGVGLEHEVYAPIYKTAQELDVPIMVHASTGTQISPAAGANRYDKFFFTHTVAHPFEQMLSVLSVVCGGVLERFPRLRVGFLEAGAGYLPFWLERLDEHYEELLGGRYPKGSSLMKMPATDYFKRQCFVTCEPDERELRHAIDVIGIDRILFASDYHHFGAKFPNTVKLLAERSDITEQEKDKLLSTNARVLYRL